MFNAHSYPKPPRKEPRSVAEEAFRSVLRIMVAKRFFRAVCRVILILCYFASQNGIAQTPVFRQFSVGNGLPSSETYCVVEDQDGYLWIGTDNGIARYDGYEFKVYDEDDGLQGLVFFTLIIGPDNTVYAMEKSGLLHYRPPGAKKFRLHPVAVSLREQCQMPLIYVKLLSITDKGELLLSGCGKGYFYCDSVGKLRPAHLDVLGMTVKEIDIQYSIFASGFEEYDSTYLQQTSVYDRMPVHFFPSSTVTPIVSDTLSGYLRNYGKRFAFMHSGRDTTWLATFNDAKLRWYRTDRQPSGPVPRLRHEAAPRFYGRSHSGGFYLAYYNNGGLFYYSDFRALIAEKGRAILDKADVSWVYEDRRGGLWVATLDEGILYAANMDSRRLGYERGLRFPNLLEILPKGRLVCRTRDFRYWLGEFSDQDRQSIVPTSWPAQTLGRRLILLEHEQLLLGPGFYIALGEGNLKQYDNANLIVPNQNLYDNFVSEVVKLAVDTLLIAGRNGVYRLSLGDMKLHFATDTIVTMIEDVSWGPGGRKVFALSAGAMELVDRTVKPFLPEFPLLRRPLTEVEMLADSSLLFAGRDIGVLWWRGDSLITIDESKGLIDNGVRDLFLDEDGIVWISTFSGLSRLEFFIDATILTNELRDGPKDLAITTGGSNKVAKNEESRFNDFQIRNFTTAQGLPTNEIHQARKRYGELWLATSGGLVNFVPPAPDSTELPPIIAAIYVNDSLILTDELQRLRPDQNNLRFEFIRLDPAQGGQINYRYRLRTNEGWQYTQQREVNYLSLASGANYFEVQSQNRDGFWSRSAIQPFFIATVWYRRGWVQAAFGLAVLSFVVWLFYRQQKRLRRETHLQQQLIDLERSALQAQMNPHFIFNCLNSINQFILENDAEQASLYLSRFARLIRQALNVSVNGTHALIDEMNMLANYLELEKLRFKDRFEYSIDLDEGLDEYNTDIPPLLVQPFVENALLHGLSERKGGGKVNIRFEGAGKNLKVVVIDNGKGFNDGKTKQHQQQSLGMSVTRKRLEILAKHNEKAVISVFTLKDKNDRARGTRVEILIRLRTTSAN